MRKGITVLICLLMTTIMLSGCLERWLDIEDTQSGTENVFSATDSAATSTEGTNDTLFVISWTEAYDDLYWGDVSMKLQVGDTIYDCTIEGDDCLISQDGDDDIIWQTNEFLTIAENDVYIVGSSGASIDLYISYRGTPISGSNLVYVQ